MEYIIFHIRALSAEQREEIKGKPAFAVILQAMAMCSPNVTTGSLIRLPLPDLMLYINGFFAALNDFEQRQQAKGLDLTAVYENYPDDGDEGFGDEGFDAFFDEIDAWLEKGGDNGN